MADMELVIKIPKEIYELCKRDKLHYEDASLLEYSVANGTPLPKGHGRLIDASNLLTVTDYDGENEKTYILYDEIEDAPTIIEADKAESEDKE